VKVAIYEKIEFFEIIIFGDIVYCA